MQGHEDRVVGVLLGLAAGDRNGGPVRMALRIAESLRDQAGLDLADVGSRYIDWWREGAFDTGPTVAQVLELVDAGVSFERASIMVDETLHGMSAGCNPAHRVAPVAMCAQIPDSAVDEAATLEARLTHRHALAGEVAAVVARLCRALIRGSSWSIALATSAEGRSHETRRAVQVQQGADLSRGGFAPEVLRAAIHFLDSSDSLSAALARSIEFAGPDNYCPVLVGSIGGARWGRSQIEDEDLRHEGTLLPRLTVVALDLARGWRGGDTRPPTEDPG
jgi:ADP-ribosylglycohydrolase